LSQAMLSAGVQGNELLNLRHNQSPNISQTKVRTEQKNKPMGSLLWAFSYDDVR